MSGAIKICILSEFAYPLLADKGDGFGGAELQMTILAKELVKRSYDVSFVTFEKSRNSPEIINGIKVYNPFNNKGSGYTYFYPLNMYKLSRVLNEIDADIYIQRAGTPLTGIVAFFTRLKNKIFVFQASSDGNVSTDLDIKTIKNYNKALYKFGVKYCDCVICQTNYQKRLLRQAIRKEGIVIKNAYNLPEKRCIKNGDSNYVLWVKRIGKEKKTELFLKLSRKMPDVKFLMIGGVSGKDLEYYHEINEKAGKINNLDFVGFVPHEEISRYYAGASLLVNTSPAEGFPNTFLEAWGNYIPVVSLNFDPDEIICKYNLGLHPKNFDDLVRDTKTLLENESLRKEMGKNGRKYVEWEHDVDKIIDEYERMFEILLT